METKILRRREKQLARATKAMREVAQEIETLVFGGPAAIEPADLLAFAAKLLATRQSILSEKTAETHIQVNVPSMTWETTNSDSSLSAD